MWPSAAAVTKPVWPTPPWGKPLGLTLDLDVPFNLQILANGILAGGVLALVAVGFSLVWGIMNIINLAHGAFIMIGAYIAWVLFTGLHIDPFLSIPITFACLFVLGYVVQRFLINFVVRAPILTTFLLTFGLSLLLVNLVLLIFHGDIKGITTWYSGARFRLGPVVDPVDEVPHVAGRAFDHDRHAAVADALEDRPRDPGDRDGHQRRAAQRREGRQVYALVFAIGAGLAGAAGSLISLSYGLQPSMGDAFIVKGFVVCVLGGLGASKARSSAASSTASSSRSARSTSAAVCRTRWRWSCCCWCWPCGRRESSEKRRRERGATAGAHKLVRDAGFGGSPATGSRSSPSVPCCRPALRPAAAATATTTILFRGILMFGAMSMGWNIIGGYAGYVSFGNVVFFGLGAYAAAFTLASTWGKPIRCWASSWAASWPWS